VFTDVENCGIICICGHLSLNDRIAEFGESSPLHLPARRLLSSRPMCRKKQLLGMDGLTVAFPPPTLPVTLLFLREDDAQVKTKNKLVPRQI
jgi:hypothetical protein